MHVRRGHGPDPGEPCWPWTEVPTLFLQQWRRSSESGACPLLFSWLCRRHELLDATHAGGKGLELVVRGSQAVQEPVLLEGSGGYRHGAGGRLETRSPQGLRMLSCAEWRGEKEEQE